MSERDQEDQRRISSSSVAYRALERANAAHEKMEAHEKLCAVRYGNINQKLGTIMSILGWAGTTLFLLIVGTLGWSIKMQISSAYAEQEALKAQIERAGEPR